MEPDDIAPIAEHADSAVPSGYYEDGGVTDVAIQGGWAWHRISLRSPRRWRLTRADEYEWFMISAFFAAARPTVFRFGCRRTIGSCEVCTEEVCCAIAEFLWVQGINVSGVVRIILDFLDLSLERL